MPKAGLPRGIRNNNPGNVKYGPGTKEFKGLVGTDGVFCRMKDMPHGVRMACVILENYQDKYNLRSVRGVISRWAPAGVDDNSTSTYIAKVAKWMKVGPDEALDLHNYHNMRALAQAIFRYENGGDYVTDAQLDQGLVLAGFRPSEKALPNVVNSKTIGAATAAGSLTMVSEAATQLKDDLSPYAYTFKYVGYLVTALTLICVGVIIYERVKRGRLGLG